MRVNIGDGGYRPAYNGQYTTDAGSGLVVGVAVTNVGSDQGQLSPAVERVRKRHGRAPAEVLADGGYVSLAEIDDLAACGTSVYAPPMPRPPRADGPPGGSTVRPWPPGATGWRQHPTPGSSTATGRHRRVGQRPRPQPGLQQFRVRGSSGSARSSSGSPSPTISSGRSRSGPERQDEVSPVSARGPEHVRGRGQSSRPARSHLLTPSGDNRCDLPSARCTRRRPPAGSFTASEPRRKPQPGS